MAPDEPTPESGTSGDGRDAMVMLDAATLQELVKWLRSQERFVAALLVGSLGATAGAVAWALVTAGTHLQIGWMAIGVGALVGAAVRVVGRGISKRFGVLGAVLALAGCLLGNLLAACALAAEHWKVPLGHVLAKLTPGLATELLGATFQPVDVIFYTIALSAGYRLSFRGIGRAELAKLVRDRGGGAMPFPVEIANGSARYATFSRRPFA